MNKDLKIEELNSKNKDLAQKNINLINIIMELEEWLIKQNIPSFELVLDKIQELKEKYK